MAADPAGFVPLFQSLLAEALEAWMAGAPLTAEQLQRLEQAHAYDLNVIGLAVSHDQAPGDYCTALDLPQGCRWCEVVAALLDHIRPRPMAPSRSTELALTLEQYGQIALSAQEVR